MAFLDGVLGFSDFLTRRRAKNDFLSKLEQAGREWVGDSESLIIDFVSGPIDRGNMSQSLSILGEFSGSMSRDWRRVEVRIPENFDARNVEDCLMVTQVLFHELGHDAQHKLAHTRMTTPEECELGLDMILTEVGDETRYRIGYNSRFIEIDTDYRSLSPTLAFCQEMFPQEDVDWVSLLKKHFSHFGRWDEAHLDEAQTVEDIFGKMSDYRMTNYLYRIPIPTAPGNPMGIYLSRYASDEFVDAWRDAVDDSDRLKLSAVGLMAMGFSSDDSDNVYKTMRMRFNWLNIDWTLSNGQNAAVLTGVFDEKGRLNEVGKRFHDNEWHLAQNSVKRREARWSSVSDMDLRLVDAFDRGLVLKQADEQGSLYVDAKGVVFGNGTKRSLEEPEVVEAVREWLLAGKLCVSPKSKVSLPQVFADCQTSRQDDSLLVSNSYAHDTRQAIAADVYSNEDSEEKQF